MRVWVIAAALLAAPAWAQVDGKAVAAGPAGAKIEAVIGGGGFNRAGMRELIQVIVADGADAVERDLLAEMASGEAVTVALDGGRSIAVPKIPDDVGMLARLVIEAPNLNTLWCQPLPAADRFFELARLSPAAHQRLYSYIGNVLDDAWKVSTLNTQFIDYSRQLNCGWMMIQTLPEDKEARGLAYDLLMTGVAMGIEKAKAEGREPPREFLYAWMVGDERRQGIVDGIQRAAALDPPEEEQ